MKTAFATLSQLKLNPAINPRHIVTDAEVDDIKAQIKHKGCIGQLWVRQARGGKLEIIDGGRRFHAMALLVKEGHLKKDEKIPVNLFKATDAEAQDLALAANYPRAALSPADEAIGFTRLALSGMAVADIASHYAVSERLVKQRIAIGSLPKAILSALRDGSIDIRAAQAFTAHSAERALKVFKEMEKKNSLRPWDVERALQDGSIPGSDRRCLFVGAEAYEAEGGVITRDLFSDNESWHDVKLLDKLFEAKIASTAQGLKDEGWSFVEIIRKNTHAIHSWGRSVAKEKRELTKEEAAELKKLKAARNALVEEEKNLEGKSDNDELSDSEQERYDAMDDLLAAVDARFEALDAPLYTARQMAKAGAVIAFEENSNHDRVEVLRGLIKPVKGGAKATAKASAGDTDNEDDGGPPTQRSVEQLQESAVYSEALTAVLESVARNATKLAMVAARPRLAYRMGLAARILTALNQIHEAPFRMEHRETEAGVAYAKHREQILKPFGLDAGNEMDEGISFAGIVAKLETMGDDAIALVEALLAADLFEVLSLKNADVQAAIALIDPDMAAEGWHPDAEFFGRLNRAQLLHAIAEIDPAQSPLAAAKKPELVETARVLAELHAWQPPPLRTPSYKGPGSNAWTDARATMLADQAAANTQVAAE